MEFEFKTFTKISVWVITHVIISRILKLMMKIFIIILMYLLIIASIVRLFNIRSWQCKQLKPETPASHMFAGLPLDWVTCHPDASYCPGEAVLDDPRVWAPASMWGPAGTSWLLHVVAIFLCIFIWSALHLKNRIWCTI